MFNLLFDKAIPKQLGQLRPANTSSAALYTLATRTQVLVTTIVICNTTGSATTFSIYNDTDGSTYSEATALCFDYPIGANESIAWEIENGIPIIEVGGTLGVKSGSSNALNFTAYGLERKT